MFILFSLNYPYYAHSLNEKSAKDQTRVFWPSMWFHYHFCRNHPATESTPHLLTVITSSTMPRGGTPTSSLYWYSSLFSSKHSLPKVSTWLLHWPGPVTSYVSYNLSVSKTSWGFYSKQVFSVWCMDQNQVIILDTWLIKVIDTLWEPHAIKTLSVIYYLNIHWFFLYSIPSSWRYFS